MQHLLETLRLCNRGAASVILTDLLKEFSIRLGFIARAGEEKKAVTFVRHYRK